MCECTCACVSVRARVCMWVTLSMLSSFLFFCEVASLFQEAKEILDSYFLTTNVFSIKKKK